MDFTHTIQELSIQVVGFLLLFLGMKQCMWKPLLRILDERRRHVEEGLRSIGQSKQELARVQADYGERLAKIEDEARVKIQQAVLEGKRIAMEIQEQARAQSAAVLHKSKEAIELELAKAKVTLRDQIVAMTTEALERILREKLDAERDKRLVEQVLEELERQPS